MNKDIKLICDFCNQKDFIKNRKMYEIQLSEILLDQSDSAYPHKYGSERIVTICDNCYKNSDIRNVLVNQDRNFK